MSKVDEKTQSLLRADAEAIAAAALRAVDGERLVLDALRATADGVVARSVTGVATVRACERVVVVGAGKAAAAMAVGVERVLGPRIATGVVLVPEGAREPLERIELREAGHPLPDQAGVDASEALVEALGQAREGDLILALVAGGGSALLARPREGLRLSDLRVTAERALGAGLDIRDLNCLRRHLHRDLGGGLARVPRAAPVLALVLSDVPHDDLGVVSSGPWAPDPSSWEDVAEVLDLLSQVPPAVQELVVLGLDGEIEDTPKDGSPIFEGVEHVLVGTNTQALVAGAAEARRRGYQASVAPGALEGDARELGTFLASTLASAAQGEPAAWLLGGESSVAVVGTGRGGRSQELALTMAGPWRGLGGLGALAVGTDGRDGPTDAAGGWVDGLTVERSRHLFIDVDRALRDNDSHTVLDAVGGLHRTGPTRTNVADLLVLLRRSAPRPA